MFIYKKLGVKKFHRTCAECGDKRITTYISKSNECSQFTCEQSFYDYHYKGKVFGQMIVLEITRDKKSPMVKHKCSICGLVSTTRFSNFISDKYNNQSHENCHKILHKQVDDVKKLKTFHERWRMMLRRCLDTKHKSYNFYSKFGVSDSWKDFMHFYFDMYSSFSEELQLDRENGMLGYSKENCRWVTPFINSINRKTTKKVFAVNVVTKEIIPIGNEKRSLRGFVEKELKGSSTTVYDRLNKKVKNETPYKGFMFFNTKEEVNEYLSVEAK